MIESYPIEVTDIYDREFTIRRFQEWDYIAKRKKPETQEESEEELPLRLQGRFNRQGTRQGIENGKRQGGE